MQYGSWAILIGVFLEGLSAFGVDQVAVQRYISSRSERTSQKGAILNLLGMWIVIPGLLMIGVGLYAYFSAHPGELGDGTLSQILAGDSNVADEAMPGFVRLHFPPGMAGLFLAALMAAIMSSIDSGVHSVTTALLVDFRDRLFPQFRPVDERTEMRRIRLLIVIIGSIAIALACFAGSMGNVFAVSKKLTAAFGGPLLALFVLGLFSRRANWLPILLSVAFATVMTLCLMYTQDWFAMWYWPIGFGTALGLGYLTSLLRPVQATEFTYAKIIRNYERDKT